MATAKKKKKIPPIPLRLSLERGEDIMKGVEAKMKKETRNRNNCLETILVEYFNLDKTN